MGILAGASQDCKQVKSNKNWRLTTNKKSVFQTPHSANNIPYKNLISCGHDVDGREKRELLYMLKHVQEHRRKLAQHQTKAITAISEAITHKSIR